MLKLVEASVQDTPNLPHDPEWAHGFALLLIRDGLEEMARIFRRADGREQIEAEIARLKSQQVGPQRAAILWAKFKPEYDRRHPWLPEMAPRPEPAEKQDGATDTPTAKVATGKGNACPPWCLVDEFGGHDEWDGGKMHHRWFGSVEMSAWPYKVNGELYHHALYVAREQVRDGAPVIEVSIPYLPKPPDRFGGTAEATAVLTMDETAELIAELQKAVSLALTAED